MNRIQNLSAVVALAFSASPLLAQENRPAPPERPPQPPSEGAPQRDRPPPEGGQRPAPGFFAALDANHDGAIDHEELSHAADLLRKLDRNNDGRITPEKMRPAGDSPRPQAGEGRGPREGGPQARPGDRRGPDDQGSRVEGRGERPRRPDSERGGDRPPRPDGAMHRDGDRPRSPAVEGPRAGGSRDGDRPDFRPDCDHGPGPRPEGRRDQRGPGDGPCHDGSPPPPRDRDARRVGPGGPPPQDFQARRDFRPGPGPGGDRFAQRPPRPDFGRGDCRALWDSIRRGGGPQGPMAMGPRMDSRQSPPPLPGRNGFGQREFRNDIGARRPDGGSGEMRPPMPHGAQFDRQDPPRREPPRWDPGRDEPRAPGEFRRPDGSRDGRGDFGSCPPRDDRGPRPPQPWPRDVQ